MMSTVGEELAEFYANATGHHEAPDLSRGIRIRDMTEWLKASVLSLVEVTLPISTSYNRLAEAAKLYSLTTQTDAATRKSRFKAFEVALRNFGAALDTAKPSNEALILGTLDVTPVPNPVADIV